ncbi:hypothetical protein LCGC14_2810350 [marine sediment metagenome]|uniref:HNH domain-containing protein n=1 Tax=marine sediment metagenome TaxID=412755 RepID=A0A0F9BBC8_9ZZZZ
MVVQVFNSMNSAGGPGRSLLRACAPSQPGHRHFFGTAMAKRKKKTERCRACGAVPRCAMAQHMKAEHSGRWWTKGGQKAIVKRWKNRGKRKAGASPLRGGYLVYLKSPVWRRKAARLKRKRKCCEVCGRGNRLHVHHLTYERIGQERPSDLIVLCEDCHEGHHTGQPIDRESRRHMESLAWLSRT